MKLIRYNYPHARSLNRLFDIGGPAFKRFDSLFEDSQHAAQQAPLDLYEDDQAFYARLEVPGLAKEAIDLNLEDGVLSIRSIQREATDGSEPTYLLKRALAVPEGVESADVSAGYEDGILTVTLPKEAAPQAHRIQVK